MAHIFRISFSRSSSEMSPRSASVSSGDGSAGISSVCSGLTDGSSAAGSSCAAGSSVGAASTGCGTGSFSADGSSSTAAARPPAAACQGASRRTQTARPRAEDADGIGRLLQLAQGLAAAAPAPDQVPQQEQEQQKQHQRRRGHGIERHRPAAKRQHKRRAQAHPQRGERRSILLARAGRVRRCPVGTMICGSVPA